MTDAAREARNAYHRKWCAANKEKRRKYNATYWEKKAQNPKESENAGKDDKPC